MAAPAAAPAAPAAATAMVSPHLVFDPAVFRNVVQGKELGSGSFGAVRVGLLPDGRYVAVKTIQIQPEDVKADNTEIKTHSALSHPNIVRYLHSFVETPKDEEPRLIVFLEFVTGGSVTSIMRTLPEKRLPPTVARVYARHMFRGLAYLHQKGIAHRDLKGDNLLISTDTGVAKIADFDQAKCFANCTKKLGPGGPPGGPTTGTISGTPYWMAPEVIENSDKGYDAFKSDIWAAGCTLVEMLTGQPVWNPMANVVGVLFKIAGLKPGAWPDAIPREDPLFQEPTLKSLLDSIFSKDPTARPTADQCLLHPYLK